LNDGMGEYVADKLMKKMRLNNALDNPPKVLIMGLTFKENCPDLRNSKVFDIIKKLHAQKTIIDVYDPWVSELPNSNEYNFIPDENIPTNEYDGIILAVAHEEFTKMGIKQIRTFGKSNHILYDLKNIFSVKDSDLRL